MNSIIKKNPVLLLTGTVDPGNMAFTVLKDTETRKNQYIDSIRFWTKNAHIPIVFVENSNTDLSEYFTEEINSKKLEIHFFDGNSYDKSLGKGFGELSCIEYGYANSSLLKHSDFVFKVTGRYKVINFPVFLKRYYDTLEVDLLVDFKWNLSFCDSRFFGFIPKFVPDYLLAYKHTLDDNNGVYFEHILAKASLQAIAGGAIYKPFITLPRIEGFSATAGVSYNSNYIHWLRYKFEYNLKYRSFGLGNLPWI